MPIRRVWGFDPSLTPIRGEESLPQQRFRFSATTSPIPRNIPPRVLASHAEGKTCNFAPPNCHLGSKKYNTPPRSPDHPTGYFACRIKRGKELRQIVSLAGFFGTQRASIVLNKQVGPLPPARSSYPLPLPPDSSMKASGFPQPLASSLFSPCESEFEVTFSSGRAL